MSDNQNISNFASEDSPASIPSDTDLQMKLEWLKSENEALLGQLQKHKQIENELDLFCQVVEQSAEGVIIMDPDGKVQYVNQSFETITGYSKSEVLDKEFDILQSDDFNENHCDSVYHKLKAGSVWRGEFTGRKKDGTTYQECSTIFPVLTPTGNIRNYVKLSRDVTDRARLEHQLRRAQKMEAIGRLAGGIAHDFNNLLTGIKGNLELARMEFKPNSQIIPFIDEIDSVADKAVELVRHLLAFSRRRVVAPKVIDPNHVINGMKKMINRMIGEQIYLNTNLEYHIKSIKIDVSQLEQVIMNLVLNARDAMPEGGDLDIETKNIIINASDKTRYEEDVAVGEYVQLKVRDSGHGIDEETLSCIFEPFFTTKGKGTGLGLSTVYGIVRQAGGYINVASAPRSGTSFKVLFPAIDEKPTPIEGYSEFRTIILGGAETVLLVEDYEILSKTIKKALIRSGYKVYFASSAEEAIKLYEGVEAKPAILVTDLLLPDMKGWDLAHYIEEKDPAIKVVFMSGYSEDVFADHYTLDRRSDFIEKPFNMRELLKKIRELLDR